MTIDEVGKHERGSSDWNVLTLKVLQKTRNIVVWQQKKEDEGERQGAHVITIWY